jgi:hypothetical protein
MDSEYVEYLESIGAIEKTGVDENGEPVWRVTKEAKELVPDLYNAHLKEFNNNVFSLWMKDFIDIEFDKEGSPLIALNEISLVLEAHAMLEPSEEQVLMEIIENVSKPD